MPYELVSISGMEISLCSDRNDIKKQFEILSHEFGHAEFSINNIGLAYLWFLIDPTDDQHHINNPNWNAAKNAEIKAQSVLQSTIVEIFFWQRISKEMEERHNAWLKGGAR
jgi:spore cortex formation protein SpoVR/YcgB (stage V sporulation)